MEEGLLKNEERAIMKLRALYRSYGYMPYKMSKFEEYDLYVRNKDFLVSDRIITFNDTNGKLMALKPDVTLSIIKNGEDAVGVKQKVYYNENVYRVSDSTHQYKEIMQAGLECVGDIDAYDIYEAVTLAAESLLEISESFVLDVAHLGILTALLNGMDADEGLRREIARCIAGKNRHELERICADAGVEAEQAERLCRFVGIYGSPARVLSELLPLCESAEARAAYEELALLARLVENKPYANRIRFDFSIVNDMNYYNGIVFRGFLSGICEGVLSGGQYDKLMRRMGRKSGAVGFALYLDLLEELERERSEFDVDTLVLYDQSTDCEALSSKMTELIGEGKRASAQKAIPQKLRYRTCVDLRKGEKE